MNHSNNHPHHKPNNDSNINHCIITRRTINIFKQQAIAIDIVKNCIATAIWAPNHHLTEPWRFYLQSADLKDATIALNEKIITQLKGIEAAKAKTKKAQQIPEYLVVTSQLSANPLISKENYAACCCALQNLSLALWAQGIGMKWSTGAIIRDTDFYSLMQINPDKEEIIGLVSYGYPKNIPTQKRKPVEDIYCIRSL